MLKYEMLIAGFFLLIKGADMFVDGSSNIAKLFKVPSIIIGLTVVALGTSLPEASISVSAAIKGQNSLALSNVLGSNIFNLLVVLGASALLLPVRASDGVIKREIPFNIGITAVLCACLLFGMSTSVEGNMFSQIFNDSTEFTLTRIGGIILLLLFALYLFIQIKDALKARDSAKEEDDGAEKISFWKSLAFIVAGAACIIFGGDIVVESASQIAATLGMSETLIGLTIVSVGTSLPELVTSVVAARKGESDLALGNAIGSSIFNILFILGASAAISPITVVGAASIYDTLILLAFSVLTLVFAATKKKISRPEGGAMILAYAAYLAYIIIR